ncbi:MAG TPA: hypothetical protein VNX26_04525 [Candidatus Acidoferrum sp.]|jgi:hypothetical protein|nr:hypothetical protein [Candidatus Acidoferrum sp.]
MKLRTGRFVLIAALALVPLATAEVNIYGKIKTRGVVNLPGQPGTHQFTHIWAYAPPSSGSSDNTTFVADVIANATFQQYVDGVSLPVAWSSIEGSAPTSTPCGPSETPDNCQPDPMVPTYHRYIWTSFDSSISQWFTVSSGTKLVNLLIFGSAEGTTNPVTPSYVTGSNYISLFTAPYGSTFARQDVVNFPQYSCSPWTGRSLGGNVARNATSGVVTVSSWTGQPFTSGDTIFVGGFQTPNTNWDTPLGGSPITSVTSTGFQYQSACPPPSTCSTIPPSTATVTVISAAESWSVPYEYPYKSALKAFWAAAVAHYGPSFTISGTNYFAQLNYFRFGGSVGSEWYPYCTTNLAGLSTPYKFQESGTGGGFTGWTDYYAEMTSYIQSLSPPLAVGWSINSAEVPPMTSYADMEAANAVTRSNGFGVRNGFGSQGLSAADSSGSSASNWYNNFQTHLNIPILELQQLSLSWPNDTTCSHGCQAGSFHYSGDLKTWLLFAWQSGATDIEIYWRDLELAFGDTGYCPLISGGTDCGAGGISLDNQLTGTAQKAMFFQAVGCSGQSGATGDCSYKSKVEGAHGQH